MTNIEKHKEAQVELTRKVIFEQDKEQLRQVAHRMIKSNNELAIQSISIAQEYEKLLYIATQQKLAIEAMGKEIEKLKEQLANGSE